MREIAKDGKLRNVLDLTKLFALGWKPTYSIEKGIKFMIITLRSNIRICSNRMR